MAAPGLQCPPHLMGLAPPGYLLQWLPSCLSGPKLKGYLTHPNPPLNSSAPSYPGFWCLQQRRGGGLWDHLGGQPDFSHLPGGGGLSLPWQRSALLGPPEVRTVSAVLCCEACCGIRVWALLSRALSCLAEHPSRTPGQVSLTECGSPKGLQNNIHSRAPPSEVFSISLGWDWESVFPDHSAL